MSVRTPSAIGVWSVQLQRRAWSVGGGAGRGRRAALWLIAAFWLAVAAGALTKGPPAGLAVAWLVVAAVSDRAGRRCRPVWQAVGLAVGSVLVLAWFVPVLQAHPGGLELSRGSRAVR